MTLALASLKQPSVVQGTLAIPSEGLLHPSSEVKSGVVASKPVPRLCPQGVSAWLRQGDSR